MNSATVEELGKMTFCDPKGSPYITTYSGKRINLLDEEIDPDCIDLEDIAWSLSRNNRWNCMTEVPITVAVHSIYAAELVVTSQACLKEKISPKEELRALLHDAAEAYICDMPRPIKYLPQMAFYLELEKKIEKAIAAHFGLPSLDKTARCAIADNILLANESFMYRPNSSIEWASNILDSYDTKPFCMTMVYMDTNFIFNKFLDLFEEYSDVS